MPGGYVCSGSMKGTLPPKAVRASVSGDKPLRRLFSKEQRAFFTAHAPDGITIDDLSVLGPIFVLKLKVQPETFSRRIAVEMWLYPDGTRVAELSTKCLPGEGLAIAEEVREFLLSKGVELTGTSRRRRRRPWSSSRRSCKPRRNDGASDRAPARERPGACVAGERNER